MRRLSKAMTTHTVIVQDFLRKGGRGEVHADPRTVKDVWVVDAQQIVRTADGAEITSNTQVFTNLDDYFPIGSLVTVWAGEPDERTARVAQVGTFRHQRLPQNRVHYLE